MLALLVIFAIYCYYVHRRRRKAQGARWRQRSSTVLLARTTRAIYSLAQYFRIRTRRRFGRRKISLADTSIRYHRRRKPPWVRNEVIRLKALMPQSGCRKIADVFNRLYLVKRRMSVGRTFVYEVLKKHAYEVQVLRRQLKHRRPWPIARNRIWGIDLTGKTDANRRHHLLFGVIEHQSRANLSLVALKDKTTITLLRHLLDTIERYGKPAIVRTDNESSFTSVLFRLGLFLLGIRHQRTDPGCPWQNGRIERFFGTLKQKLDRWEVSSLEELNGALGQFRLWYNHVRSHQHLDGRTPAEVWGCIDIYAQRAKREYWFEAWEGLLSGFYLRH